MSLTRSITSALTRPLARKVTEAGGGVWQAIANAGVLKTAPYTALMQRGRDGLKTNVLVLGDSIGFGYGSTGTDATMRMNGFGPLIATRLRAAGIKARAQGIFGNGKQHATPFSHTYDNRFTYAAGQGIVSIGGNSFLFNAAGHTLSFTPTDNVDTFEIYCYRFGGGGLVSYAVDGGATTNINFNGTAGLNTVTVSGLSAGTHTLTLAYVSGAGGYVLGVNGYDSAQQGLQFVNGALNGATTADFTPNTNAWDARRIGTAFAPSATMIVLGANHWNQALSVSAFSADLQTLVTAYAATGPVILVSDPASNFATKAATSVQREYVAAMRSVASANGVLMFDLWTHFGGAQSTFGANWMADGIHPSAAGYAYGADLIANALATA